MMYRHVFSITASVAMLVLVLLGSSQVTHAAFPGANRCLINLGKCMARKTICLLNVEATARMTDTSPDAAKLQTCHDRFDGDGDPTKGCFARVDAGPEDCGLTAATAQKESDIDDFLNDVVGALDPNPANDKNTCTAAKLRCVKKLLSCFFAVDRNVLRSGGAYGGTFQHCRNHFDGDGDPTQGCFAKRELRDGCLTTGDTSALETRVACFMNSIQPFFPDPWHCPTPTPTPSPTATP